MSAMSMSMQGSSQPPATRLRQAHAQSHHQSLRGAARDGAKAMQPGQAQQTAARRGGTFRVAAIGCLFILLLQLAGVIQIVRSAPGQAFQQSSVVQLALPWLHRLFPNHLGQQGHGNPSSPLASGGRALTFPSNHTIIVMGLPRSGSEAIHDFFACHGWVSTHYCCSARSDVHEGLSTSSSASSRFAMPSRFPCHIDRGTTTAADTLGGDDAPINYQQTSTCGKCVIDNMQSRRRPFDGCHFTNPANEQSDTQPRAQSHSYSQSHNHITVWSSFHTETSDPTYSYFLPQHFAIPLLHEAYPTATWILNTRDTPERWAKSVMHWNSITQRLWNAFGLSRRLSDDDRPRPSADAHVTQEQILEDLQIHRLDGDVYNHTRHLQKRELLKEVYRNHTKRIQAWSRHPLSSDRLFVHVNVDDETETNDILTRLVQTIRNGLGAGTDMSPLSSMPSSPLVAATSSVPPYNPSCRFQFDSTRHDNDWMNFTFPF